MTPPAKPTAGREPGHDWTLTAEHLPTDEAAIECMDGDRLVRGYRTGNIWLTPAKKGGVPLGPTYWQKPKLWRYAR